MKILVVYMKLGNFKDRNTIDESLFSFRRYVKNANFYYFNAANGIPRYLTRIAFDGVIFHYTFLAARWSKNFYKRWSKTLKNLKELKGYKVAIPQDEYAETETLWELLLESGVKTVFTMASDDEHHKLYPPERVPLEHLFTVFPGYVDEFAVEKVKAYCKSDQNRTIDLGYRARKLPYWLGRHGQLKHEIGEIFQERSKGTGLRTDISTDGRDVFLGDGWYRFLCSCRAVLGCEGGVSLFDPTGKVRVDVEQYVKENPQASFEEAEKNCFAGMDHNIRLFSLSPRFFECAITKTCQVLLEGKYAGVLLPGIHYIELKKDYSNVDEVIEVLRDQKYCSGIAEKTYNDIVKSGKYTYRVFANQVVNHIAEASNITQTGEGKKCRRLLMLKNYLIIRELLEPLLVKFFYGWLGIKLYKGEIIETLFRKIKEKYVKAA
jgi:hypothetical protein